MSQHEIDFGTKFDKTFTARPPHMSTEDWPIWYRYLAEYGHLYDSFYFDVCLPSSCECPEDTPHNMKKMWNRVTGKRIDALCYSHLNCWTIVECRIHASCGALGSLLTYYQLWREHTPHHTCRLVIATDTLDPDLVKVCPIYDVKLIKV